MVTIDIDDRKLFGTSMFVMAFFGACGNWMVSLLALKIPTLRNAFGRLSCSQATAEAVLLTVFFTCCAPIAFFGLDDWQLLSRHFGYINLVAYDICCWSHLFISINRFCAIFFPLKYDRWFSNYNTRILIAISWLIPIVVVTYMFKWRDCDFYFNTGLNAFIFTTTEDCKVIADIDFYKDISIVIIISVFDITTLIKVHLTNGEVISDHTKQSSLRRKREINFLKQAILQGVIFVFELITYFILAWKTQNKYLVFLFTTFAWISVHSLDGYIILVFNRGFFKVLRGVVKRGRVSTFRTTSDDRHNQNPPQTSSQHLGVPSQEHGSSNRAGSDRERF